MKKCCHAKFFIFVANFGLATHFLLYFEDNDGRVYALKQAQVEYCNKYFKLLLSKYKCL